MRLPRALSLLRSSLHYRKDAFSSGLQANGFHMVDRMDRPEPGDLLVTWNRYGAGQEMAQHFERHGASVLVAENGFLGKAWRGGHWFTLALGHCAGAGRWADGGPSRWDSWGVDLAPWQDGDETVIFAQRQIGEGGLASPVHWAEHTQQRIGGRIRPHPGKTPDAKAVPLAEDLKNAKCVVTWHSAAALMALTMGVAAVYECESWIGAEAGTPLSQWPELKRDDAARLSMFRRAAWAMWSAEEIKSGAAFAHLLSAA